MTDTKQPTDAEIDAQWRESVAKHETTAAFVRDFARAVLARWGAPQPVARAPLTADDIRQPKNGQWWRVEWWNESCRMLLPADKKLDSFQSYKNGTLMFTIKARGATDAR